MESEILYCYLVSFMFTTAIGAAKQNCQEITTDKPLELGFQGEFISGITSQEGVTGCVITSVFSLGTCTPEEWEAHKAGIKAGGSDEK